MTIPGFPAPFSVRLSASGITPADAPAPLYDEGYPAFIFGPDLDALTEYAHAAAWASAWKAAPDDAPRDAAWAEAWGSAWDAEFRRAIREGWK